MGRVSADCTRAATAPAVVASDPRAAARVAFLPEEVAMSLRASFVRKPMLLPLVSLGAFVLLACGGGVEVACADGQVCTSSSGGNTSVPPPPMTPCQALLAAATACCKQQATSSAVSTCLDAIQSVDLSQIPPATCQSALDSYSCSVGGGGGYGGYGGGGWGGAPTCVDTCAAAITDGGEVCAGTASTDIYWTLLDCANAACQVECMDLIQSGPCDTTCGTCLTTNCPTELDACSNN
jgi:hypothetical protein